MAYDPNNARTPGLTLRAAWRFFWRQPSPRMLASFVLFAALWRVSGGPWSWLDVGVGAAVVAFQPLAEWLIHVFVLHFRPRKFGPLTLDYTAAREHRMHHRDPHDTRYWFIPAQTLVLSFVAGTVVLALLLSAEFAATWLFVTMVLALVYEWVHFLVHTSYRPRSKWVQGLELSHRLHHFKNEHYWMGVSVLVADRVLGTAKNPREVETSRSCRDLGL